MSKTKVKQIIYYGYILYPMQVFLGQNGGLDTEGNELPRLVYVSREKRPGFQHHKKAGAMNALVSVIFNRKYGSYLFPQYTWT